MPSRALRALALSLWAACALGAASRAPHRSPLLSTRPSARSRLPCPRARLLLTSPRELLDRGSVDALCAALDDEGATAGWSEEDWVQLYAGAAGKGLLKGYGRLEAGIPEAVSVPDLQTRAGLPIEALTPRNANLQWAAVGVVLFLLEAAAAKTFGLANGLTEALPLAVLGLLLDQTLFGSQLTLAVARVVYPQLTEKLARHEAGHFLLAYLYGLPVTGYFLAGRPLTVGQAGTAFLDPDLQRQLQRGEIRQGSLARFSTILMGGIAAEAITFNNAEGGFADEQTLVAMLSSLRPKWEGDKILNLARWSVLSAVTTLRAHQGAHDALTKAMRRNAPLGECVRAIEEALAESPVAAGKAN